MGSPLNDNLCVCRVPGGRGLRAGRVGVRGAGQLAADDRLPQGPGAETGHRA